MSKTPNKESVTITKITRLRAGGLALQFEITEMENGSTYVAKETKESDKTPHPDLTEKMQRLKLALTKSWGLPGEQEEIDQWAASNIEISSISLNRDGDAVVITGKVKVETGAKVAMNSPRIDLTQDSYGIEDATGEILDALIDEAYEYLYKNKRAQLELFDSNNGDETPGEN
jgi:hypothetical protein